MAVNSDVIGKIYPGVSYAVGREKVREYAKAVGESNPLHLDVEAARAAGYDDVVAPPMFAVVYSFPALWPALFDPEIGIDFSRMVHGGQEFEWGPLVVAGDEIMTTVSVADISERAGNGFFVFVSESVNQRGETVCTGRWSNIVRGA
ncbi:MAG TPA: MaoC family dehydratase N-terminal domain-containing protein [Solirubrobacteraceae bacterium]|nr:MaoC family dehydratase N-terminal domain-containing protein [Solirubrobacteraceae bacterium]